MPAPPVAVGAPDPVALVAIAEIVARCAPWADLVVGDALADGDHGLYVHDDAGRAWIGIATGQRMIPCVVQTAHHEIWHAIEMYLSPAALDAVSIAAARGHYYDDAYLDSPVEQRARLYAAVASAWGHGLTLRADRVLAILWCVYTGALARQVVAQERRRDARPPFWRRACAMILASLGAKLALNYSSTPIFVVSSGDCDV